MTKALILAALLVSAPLVESRAQAPSGGSLGDLARAWSGHAAPACEQIDTEGHLVDGQLDPWRCVWVETDSSRISGMLDDAPRPSMVMWERTFADTAALDRSLDSLRATFVARGMTLRDCGGGPVPAGYASGTFGEGAGLEVMLSSVVGPPGPPRMIVAVVSAPARMPELVRC